MYLSIYICGSMRKLRLQQLSWCCIYAIGGLKVACMSHCCFLLGFSICFGNLKVTTLCCRSVCPSRHVRWC